MECDSPDFTIFQRVISSRWMLPILHNANAPKRFGDIQSTLNGLSSGVLASQLQALRQMGLLSQMKYPCFPPRVEYQITRKGQRLLDIMAQLPMDANYTFT